MSKTHMLEWENSERGVTFRVLTAHHDALPITEWGTKQLHGVFGRTVSLSPLNSVIDETAAAAPDTTGVTLSPHEVEALSEVELSRLGLPPAAPLRLRLRGEGLINSPAFRLQPELTHANGSPVMGIQRDGAMVQFGEKKYVLLFPMYSLLEKIDQFGTSTTESQQERMLQWAELKALLPDDAEIEGMLRTLNVVRADAFSIDTDTNGDISPLLRHQNFS
ncbi:hypothetical protein RM531_15940, partial [Salinisphaera sp. P385]